MLYEIERAVFERFPGYARMVVVAEGVDNNREIPELAELLAQCEKDVCRDELEDFWHVPALEAWAGAFSGMGIKPTNAVINVDAMPPLPLAAAEQAAEEAAGLLRRFTGAKTAIHKLTAEAPRFVL